LPGTPRLLRTFGSSYKEMIGEFVASEAPCGVFWALE